MQNLIEILRMQKVMIGTEIIVLSLFAIYASLKLLMLKNKLNVKLFIVYRPFTIKNHDLNQV